MMTEFNAPYMKNMLLAAAFTFVCAPLWAAPPTGPDEATVVLPPGVEKKIEAAFGRAAPTWKLESAKVQKDRVDAKVCAETCVELTLTDPKGACDGKTVGPWCVTYKGDAPGNIALLEAALAKDAIADVWKVIPARPAQPAEAPPEDAKEATGTQLETAGPQGSQAEKGDSGHQKSGDNTTLLLVIALLSAAVATFALFRLRDEDEQTQDAALQDAQESATADDEPEQPEASEEPEPESDAEASNSNDDDGDVDSSEQNAEQAATPADEPAQSSEAAEATVEAESADDAVNTDDGDDSNDDGDDSSDDGDDDDKA